MRTSRQPRPRTGNAGMWAGGCARGRRRAECRLITVLLAYSSPDAKKGRFELADRGPLFLDEIGDISLELQPKLLRAVQEQEFERLGSAKTVQVDVRIIAATHRDLPVMIRDEKFREDLFYRLNVFPIEIPPLRERSDDIPLLVNYFVSKV